MLLSIKIKKFQFSYNNKMEILDLKQQLWKMIQYYIYIIAISIEKDYNYDNKCNISYSGLNMCWFFD